MGRQSTKDYIRFLIMARGSIFELTTQVDICQRLTYGDDWTALRQSADEVSRLLQGLIQSLTKPTTP